MGRLTLPLVFVIQLVSIVSATSATAGGIQGKREGTATADTVKKKAKSPTGAMWRSLAFPGWGQWYNGKKLKAALAFGAETGVVGAAVYFDGRLRKASTFEDQEYWRDRRNLMYWWLGAAILLSMADAYVDAQLSDFDEGPELSAALPRGDRQGVGSTLRLKIRLPL